MSRRQAILEQLRQYESPGVTYLPEGAQWPIVWERAKGMHVWDSAGNDYVDFTAAFGVAAGGHAAPPVVAAGKRQMGILLHAMGDVHPHPLKAALAARLSELTFGRWNDADHGKGGRVVFCNSGFESIEVAFKTACQATGRDGVISFDGAYHGLGYGALVGTSRPYFRGRFGGQVGQFGERVPFPESEADLALVEERLEALLRTNQFGAVLVEPIQGRGGIRVPPDGFLPMLRRLCDEFEVNLVFDEIYTGFGRTGQWFACEHEGVEPDMICLGKALTGGFPLSAMVGRAELMERAWPKSPGEAVHTSTFLGHPVGCAMALAQIELIERRRLVARSARQGKGLIRRLRVALDGRPGVSIRGRGLMVGVVFADANGKPDGARSLGLVESLLHEGFLVLPDGEFGEVLGLTPPLIVSRGQIDSFVGCLSRLCSGRGSGRGKGGEAREFE